MSRGTYACDHCGRQGVRLWREYSTLADHTKLLCRPCSCADQRVDFKEPRNGDQIRELVPAIPTPLPSPNGRLAKRHSFWGYSSVPEPDIEWWYSLP